MLKRWVGPLAAIATALVLISPGAAQADFDREVCVDVDGQITGITAVGPGLVAVEGWARPRAATPWACDTAAKLTAHAGPFDVEYWYAGATTGSAAVVAPDGQFTVGLTAGRGTLAVCLETTDGRPLNCYQVTVQGGDAASGETVGTPIIGGRISVHQGEIPKPPPCGHCM